MDVTSDWFWEGNVVEAIARALVQDGWTIVGKADTHSKERASISTRPGTAGPFWSRPRATRRRATAIRAERARSSRPIRSITRSNGIRTRCSR